MKSFWRERFERFRPMTDINIVIKDIDLPTDDGWYELRAYIRKAPDGYQLLLSSELMPVAETRVRAVAAMNRTKGKS